MLENIDNKTDVKILEEFIYDNPELEELEEIVGEFNIFTALNIENNEIRHSIFLSWLLDPSESHGLGDYFLSLFLKEVAHITHSTSIDTLSVLDIDSWNFDDAEVLREWRNIDIFIRSDIHKMVCVIENKIYSTEGEIQLLKYKEIVERHFPDYKRLFVYLTIKGDKPTVEDYKPLSYGEIIPLIKHLLDSKEDKIGTEISTFISHYYEMLRRQIMQDSEIQKKCLSIYKKHKKALDLIFKYKPDRLLEIYECLIAIIEADNDLILDTPSKSNMRFTSKELDFIPKEGSYLKSERIIIFEFNNYQDYLSLYLIIYPGSKEIREKLYRLTKIDLRLFNVARKKLAEKFSAIYKMSILRSKELEDKDIEEIREIIKEKMKDFKENDYPKIINVMKQFEIS